MKKYIIASGKDSIELQNEVNRKIEEGYHPFGNLVTMFNSNMDEPNYFQPMIKHEQQEYGTETEI